jgi:hypothetical protein
MQGLYDAGSSPVRRKGFGAPVSGKSNDISE